MTAPTMPPELAEVELRVFAAAKKVEQASQYGRCTAAAMHELEAARTERALMRLLVAS